MWTREQFDREMGYRVAMFIAREMLVQGIIGNEDYRVFSTKFAVKFLPVSAALLPKSDFISAQVYGNMLIQKGGVLCNVS